MCHTNDNLLQLREPFLVLMNQNPCEEKKNAAILKEISGQAAAFLLFFFFICVYEKDVRTPTDCCAINQLGCKAYFSGS